MTSDLVHVIGGPLDGSSYDLSGAPGETIELSTAAGVCTYRFAAEDDGLVLHYVGRTTARTPEPSAEDILPDAIEELGTTEPLNTDDGSENRDS